MSAETASQPGASGASPADASRPSDASDGAGAPQGASTPDGVRAQSGTHEVVMALLKQQEALLAELRWAYDQLERTEESEIVALKARVAQLEEQSSGRTSSGSLVRGTTTVAARTRRRLALSWQDPDRAVRLVGRRLRRPIGRLARRAGISR